jgi:hypothetical protein
LILVEWDRAFELWSYAFSYSRLLLRSAPAFDKDLRVDVVFSNVEYLNIPARLTRLSIRQADFETEGARLGVTGPSDPASTLFLLNGGPFYVVATQCGWHEDHEWVGAPTHFAPFRGVEGADI